VSLIDPSFRQQTAIKVGSQPMDMAFRGDELFVACQGDGSASRTHQVSKACRRNHFRHAGARRRKRWVLARRCEFVGAAGEGRFLKCDISPATAPLGRRTITFDPATGVAEPSKHADPAH